MKHQKIRKMGEKQLNGDPCPAFPQKYTFGGSNTFNRSNSVIGDTWSDRVLKKHKINKSIKKQEWGAV